MIDVSSLNLLKGKKALVTGIANDQSIAWGCAKAFHAFGAEIAITYLNEKAKPHVEPLAKEVGAPIFMPLDLQHEGQLEVVFEKNCEDVGKARSLPALHCVCSQGRLAGPRRRLFEGWISPRNGDFVLVVYQDGQTCGAAYDVRRHVIHDDLLRLANGRGALQHDGPSEGRA